MTWCSPTSACRRSGSRVLIEDIHSANGTLLNGTLLNGERLLAPTELHDGDPVAIGEAVLTFHDPDTPHRDGTAVDLEVDRAAAWCAQTGAWLRSR